MVRIVSFCVGSCSRVQFSLSHFSMISSIRGHEVKELTFVLVDLDGLIGQGGLIILFGNVAMSVLLLECLKSFEMR